MKIAIYTIAKNEEQFVQRWYESTKDADGLFILDTGSSDKTIEIAESLGIKVEVLEVKPWRFDTARNASLAMISDDYDICIALDMDEVLVEGWRKELEKVSAQVTRPRYRYVWSWKDEKPDLQYGGDKIHSRHGYVWKHPVHEVLYCESGELQEWCGLEIHHHPDHTKSRGQYFPLLELAVQEDPEDDRSAHYLAREYFFHGMFDKAAAEFKRHLSLPRAQWLPERSASMRYLAKCEPHMREVWLLRAAAECPGHREAWVDLAHYYHQQQAWSACLSASERALSITDRPLEYLSEGSAWGADPYDLAAVSAYHLGLHMKASEYGSKAVEIQPDDIRLRTNLCHYAA